MEYFMFKLDADFTHAPNLINWFSTFDVRMIRPDAAAGIPYRNLIEISPDEALIFSDLITMPYLLISERLRPLIEAYEPLVEFKDIILLDKVNKQYALYYLPILDTVDCLHKSSELNLDHSIIRKAVFDRSKIKEQILFRIGGVKNTYIAVRLDLAESLLRRKAVGLYLEPIEFWGAAQ